MKVCVLMMLFFVSGLQAHVLTGIDRLHEDPVLKRLQGKRIGLITNHTGVDAAFVSSYQKMIGELGLNVVALFGPEHGIDGIYAAGESVASKTGAIPIYSLHGATRRPTDAMLKDIDILVYDIQDVGVRAYTYVTTLFYAMEEAAKHNIPVVVLDRPNPLTGEMIDGPMLDEKEVRSFIGYINVPYCHGMTVGELAHFFNREYEVKADLHVVKMAGWNRAMTYKETGLSWIPTSPHIPEADTPYYSASTGILGELSLVNIGVGYTLPFKLVGAPWINKFQFADHLNQQKLPGVYFLPYTYKPYYGTYKGEECHGVLIKILNHATYRPLSVQMLLLGCLKSLYPQEVTKRLQGIDQSKKNLFTQAIGSHKFLKTLENEKFAAWKLIDQSESESRSFLKKRELYLFPEYAKSKSHSL